MVIDCRDDKQYTQGLKQFLAAAKENNYGVVLVPSKKKANSLLNGEKQLVIQDIGVIDVYPVREIAEQITAPTLALWLPKTKLNKLPQTAFIVEKPVVTH